MRRGDREAEGGALLRRYTGLNPYRGFESLPLRQIKMGPHRAHFYLATSGGFIRTLWFDQAITDRLGKRAVLWRVSVEANLQVMPELQFF